MERPGGRSGQISLNLQDLGLVQDYQPKSVNLWRVGIICEICCLWFSALTFAVILASVDDKDPHVFGPPGS